MTPPRLSSTTSQRVFDTLLRSLAEPGTIRFLPVDYPEVEPALALALALADVGVIVNVDDDPDHPWSQAVAEATGATVGPVGSASIVISTSPTPALFERVAVGDPLTPEDGARVALAVAGLATGPAAGHVVVELRGPGVPGRRVLAIDGPGPEVVGRLGTGSGPFPTGFDTWLFARDGSVVGVPRSTTVDLVADGNEPVNGATPWAM
ncbi:MAG: phosphonate C-P lyase system protein PhnH [Acidimicrobiales bacterium]